MIVRRKGMVIVEGRASVHLPANEHNAEGFSAAYHSHFVLIGSRH